MTRDVAQYTTTHDSTIDLHELVSDRVHLLQYCDIQLLLIQLMLIQLLDYSSYASILAYKNQTKRSEMLVVQDSFAHDRRQVTPRAPRRLMAAQSIYRNRCRIVCTCGGIVISDSTTLLTLCRIRCEVPALCTLAHIKGICWWREGNCFIYAGYTLIARLNGLVTHFFIGSGV